MNYYQKYIKYKHKYLDLLKYKQIGGFDLPLIGFGTWQNLPDNDNIERIIYDAIKIGYRCFDCAYTYRNQIGIGRAFTRAINEGIITRSDLFIIGKATNIENFKKSLIDLQLEYFDLALYHFYNNIENWELMIRIKSECLTKEIGLSNIYINKLRKLIIDCETKNIQKPKAIENEINLFTPEEELVDYCNCVNIKLIAYTPLGQQIGIEVEKKNEILRDISSQIECTIPQLILLWGMKRNITVIPTSSNIDRMTENFLTKAIYERSETLSEEQIEILNKLLGYNYPLIETAQDYRSKDI
jgi:diketogulonate reductase-like aldo/keto reductase